MLKVRSRVNESTFVIQMRCHAWNAGVKKYVLTNKNNRLWNIIYAQSCSVLTKTISFIYLFIHIVNIINKKYNNSSGNIRHLRIRT